MRENIKSWYCNEYPTDDLGRCIPPNLIFRDLFDTLDHGGSVYKMLGEAADSLVRERLFSRLAVICDCDYSYIYDQWLHYCEE